MTPRLSASRASSSPASASPTSLSPAARARTRGVRLTVGLLLLALLAAVGLAGCGGDDDNASSAEGTAMAARDEAPQAADGAGGDAGQSAAGGEAASKNATGTSGGSDQRTSARVLPIGRDIVYRGSVTVRVRDVARAAQRAERLALSVDGVVFSEQTSAAPDQRRRGQGEATLSLRVPPTQFSATLDALGRLGRELSRTRSAQDVTAELADTGSRVRSQERSVARVRSLLSEADTIGEVVQVEAELARREADLESLQAQLARLEDVTDLASIDVTLVGRGVAAPPPSEEEELGFLAGLRGGWEAFVGILLVALTVLGALLPFALAGALIGVPAYLLFRSRRNRPPAGGTATTQA